MSSAFVREGEGMPQVFGSRESAESAVRLNRSIDPAYEYEVRERGRGGFMVARLTKNGEFDSWVSE